MIDTSTDTPPLLAGDFPQLDEARWRVLVDKVLKGADFERRLVTTTADGITTQGDVLADAIKPVLASSTISLFTDPKGNLWVTVTAETGAWLIELEPKAP